MIYGDNPQKINEREDKLGLKSYSYAPQIAAIMQAGNLYIYGISNPVFFFDPTGKLAGSATVGIAVTAGATNAWNPVGWVVLGGVAVLLGIFFIAEIVETHSEGSYRSQVHVAKRDRNGVNWNADKNKKNHIFQGTKGRHAPKWRSAGIDPNNPNSWNHLLPILQEVFEHGREYLTEAGPNGTTHYYEYYVDSINRMVVVVIQELKNGLQVLSDAFIK